MNNVSRRRFLEQSMLATAAAMVPVTPTIAQTSTRRSASPNEIIRVGVLGVRGRGRAHVAGCTSQDTTAGVQNPIGNSYGSDSVRGCGKPDRYFLADAIGQPDQSRAVFLSPDGGGHCSCL